MSPLPVVHVVAAVAVSCAAASLIARPRHARRRAGNILVADYQPWRSHRVSHALASNSSSCADGAQKLNRCVESCGGRDERTASTCRQPNPDQTKADQSHGASPSAVSAHRVRVDLNRPQGFSLTLLDVAGGGVRQRRTGCQLFAHVDDVVCCLAAAAVGKRMGRLVYRRPSILFYFLTVVRPLPPPTPKKQFLCQH